MQPTIKPIYFEAREADAPRGKNRVGKIEKRLQGFPGPVVITTCFLFLGGDNFYHHLF